VIVHHAPTVPKEARMLSTSPPIQNFLPSKFIEEHPLSATLVVAYQYAKKYYPEIVDIDFSFSESYYGDSDESYIVVEIGTTMTPEEALEARSQFYQAIRQLPKSEYISIYHRFIDQNATT
jgi:hypothetical protein